MKHGVWWLLCGSVWACTPTSKPAAEAPSRLLLPYSDVRYQGKVYVESVSQQDTHILNLDCQTPTVQQWSPRADEVLAYMSAAVEQQPLPPLSLDARRPPPLSALERQTLQSLCQRRSVQEVIAYPNHTRVTLLVDSIQILPEAILPQTASAWVVYERTATALTEMFPKLAHDANLVQVQMACRAGQNASHVRRSMLLNKGVVWAWMGGFGGLIADDDPLRLAVCRHWQARPSQTDMQWRSEASITQY